MRVPGGQPRTNALEEPSRISGFPGRLGGRPSDSEPRVTSSRLTRRTFLRTAGAAGLTLLAAACEPTHASSDLIDWKEWWARRDRTGTVDFANWPYYIDRRRDDSHPSLELFTKRSGISVNYYRPIRDDQAFLQEIRPALAAGRPTGYDIIVVTNGPQLDELIEHAWLTPLDLSRLPTFQKQASATVRDPYWDPGNQYSVAWQSGLTGIAYRPEAVNALGRPPNGLLDLWSNRLNDRVGMFTDLMDLGSAGLLALGIDPATSTELDWQEAAGALRRQRDRGLVRRYYDQGYIGALQRGDIWVSQAWSGDIYQAQRLGHEELRFVVPSEGVVFWTDNMLIPRAAEHPVDALALMDFVYRPHIAARIADWVWYICPVPAAKPIVAHDLADPMVADSQLVFPGDQITGIVTSGAALLESSPLRYYPRLRTSGERSRWQQTFGSVVAGA
jgi:spermidine/putrescine transport system substrate-binding protein